MDDKISKALGLQPMSLQKQIMSAVNDAVDDTEQASNNIKGLINKGNHSFEELLQLASSLENPRAYEVAATFLKTLVDANRELAELSLKKGDKNITTDNRQIHNHMYIGSTSDLLKMMKQAKQDDAG
jgi:hypothetical protein